MIPPRLLLIPHKIIRNRFCLTNLKQHKTDKDCKLGVHTASNQSNEKNYEFYWGYKNHVLVDCISRLPVYEITTTADVHDSSVALDILADIHAFLPITECTFLADKGYDVKNNYN
ncbi:MAG: transposase [Lachnospiraceae bacterium]